MAKFLAIYTDTINEIEVNGFMVMSEKDVEHYEDLASSITWSFTYKIGEEEIEFSSGEDLLARIDFRELSSEENKAIKKLFNGQFGIFIGEDYLEDLITEEEEIDDDEEDDDYGDDNYRRDYDEDLDENY